MTDELNSRLRSDPLIADLRGVSVTAGAAVRPSRGFLGMGLALACSGVLWLSWAREPRALQAASTSHAAEAATDTAPPSSPQSPSTLVRFADGSQAELHGATSRLVSEQTSPERVRLQLAGGARFDLVSNPARSFAVSNAQVLVRAFGTAFSVDPEGVRTRVAAEHGRVQVMWWSGATILNEGEVGIFPPENEPAFAPRGPFVLAEETARSRRAKRARKQHATRVSGK